MPKPRLLLADDHELVLLGLRELLIREFDVVGVAADGESVIAAARTLQPDMILLDIAMPSLNGIDAGRRIHRENPAIKLIYVTQQTDRTYVEEALRVGASAYVLKQSAASQLVTAVREVMAGRVYISPLLMVGKPAAGALHKGNPAELFTVSLTARQRQVLQLVAEGLSLKEIGISMNISVKTVEYHKAGLMNELGLRTTAELTRYAIQHGLVQS